MTGNMTGIRNCFALLFVLLSWKIVSCEEREHFDDLSNFSEKDMFHAKDSRLSHSLPDMRFVLNDMLRYENIDRHPTEADHILTLSSRSKGTPYTSDDPVAMLATGFQGSRGKRPSYNEIPVFANGFPANRG